MKARRRLAWLPALLTTLVGMAIVAAAGWSVLRSPLAGFGGEGGPLSRLGFDLPFLFRQIDRPEICLVYMDENAERALGQTSGIWERKVHAELVRRLTQAGARAIFFDIVFYDKAADPTQDEDFAAALQESGRGFIGALLTQRYTRDDVLESEQIFPPTPVLRKAATGWGLLAFRPDEDYGLRYLDTGTAKRAASTWEMAKKLGAPLPEESARISPRWLNFYGPAESYASVGYDRAMDPDAVPPGFFKDKVVFVGGLSGAGPRGRGKDDFHHPYTRTTNRFAPGVVFHATAFLNLFRGEWLVRLDRQREDAAIIAFGLLLAVLLPRFSPIAASIITIVLVVAVASAGVWLVFEKRIWFAWTIPVLVQAPLGLTWAIGTRYFLEGRRRKKLRKAFGHYLSEEMADQIADANFDLTPGGEVVEATIIFTDLEGFTSLSENLGDPKKLSDVLIAYFTNTTQHVLENQGTIIKYIGDAVLAVWGAPLADADHAYKAMLAAWRMHEASEQKVLGHTLTTRVGVNTGEVLAGNLGSAYRFDYTVIGDAVNFAARLEGLNKYFGTRILVSDATAGRCNGRFVTRRLGDFKVVGKNKTTGIHELLGPAPVSEPMPWVATFATGLEAFCKGDLDGAERQMQETLALHGGRDGPATFYLKKIGELRTDGLPEGWTGAVEFTSK